MPRNRGQMAAFRKLVRREVKRATGVSNVSRIRIVEQVIAAGLNTAPLLIVDDDPDYDLATSGAGATIAEVQAKSRLTRIDLTMNVQPAAPSDPMEWMLIRDPDGALTAATAPSTLMTADVSLTTAMLRKNALAYGWIFGNTNNENKIARVRIRTKAMRRVATLNDGDVLRFHIFNHAAAVGGLLWMWGRIYTRLG